ncbi:hypothetical protein LB504_012985 [Fusarium proliferatum]|nr:hypothetical protein LB504_012985 [Fusarium proliferatum]
MKISHVSNLTRLDKAAEAEAAVCMKNLANWAFAVEEIAIWPEYTIQPLRSLPNYARAIGVDQLFVKDESKRFGTDLGSFKALGAPYAVYKILSEEVYKVKGVRPTAAELRTHKYRDITEKVTVCVATDGNQGRGLAYGAKIFGCRCVDYIHDHVSEGRKKRMMDYGAIVIRIDGEYEASVARAKEDARMNGWYFVSSSSWSDFDNDIAQHVMNAYMVVVHETLSKLPSVSDITHVFVCGGVGSIAAAVYQGFYTHLKAKGLSKVPRFILVEPSEADCLLQSAKHGEMKQSEGTLRTCMAGLACRAPSPAAWKILRWLTSDFLAVPDSFAVNASGSEGDVPLVIGESSAASMGVMTASKNNADLRSKLGLDSNSQVVLFGLEGATDPEIYERLVGKSSKAVFDAQESYEGKDSVIGTPK